MLGTEKGDNINLRVQAYSCHPVWGGKGEGGRDTDLKAFRLNNGGPVFWKEARSSQFSPPPHVHFFHLSPTAAVFSHSLYLVQIDFTITFCLDKSPYLHKLYKRDQYLEACLCLYCLYLQLSA